MINEPKRYAFAAPIVEEVKRESDDYDNLLTEQHTSLVGLYPILSRPQSDR